MHFGQGMGIKTICRELNLSKKAVRKVVRSGATAFEYERAVQPQRDLPPVFWTAVSWNIPV